MYTNLILNLNKIWTYKMVCTTMFCEVNLNSTRTIHILINSLNFVHK